MNKVSIALSSLALLGVIILSTLHIRSNDKSKPAATTTSTKTAAEPNLQGGRIAYVDIDTFNANYESLKAKKAEFEVQKNAMKNELQRSAAQFRADFEATQRKYQAGTLSQSDAAAAEQRLGKTQQDLAAREEKMTQQFQEKLEAFNKELQERMNTFLAEYAETHGLDYVFSYSQNLPVLIYGKPTLNITQDVIKGMNDRAKSVSEAGKSK